MSQTPTLFEFDEQLAMSVESQGRPYEQIIADTLPGVVSVMKTTTAMDRSGIDYVATLRRGTEVFVDLKSRTKGCSQFWRRGPELSLEIWSVMPENGRPGKAGWTLDESKATHYTLHVFDPSDTTLAYLLPFQLLRKAFVESFSLWTRQYFSAPQRSNNNGVRWGSRCVFVPASVVLTAIHKASVCPTEQLELTL